MNCVLIGVIIGTVLSLPGGSGAAATLQNSRKFGYIKSMTMSIGVSIGFFAIGIISTLINAIAADWILKLGKIVPYTLGAMIIANGILGFIGWENELETDNSSKSGMVNFMTGIMFALSRSYVILITFFELYLGIRYLEIYEIFLVAGGVAIAALVIWIIIPAAIGVADKISEIKTLSAYKLFTGIIIILFGLYIILESAGLIK